MWPLYQQAGWEPAPQPLLLVSVAVITVIWVFETYIQTRQHGHYSVKQIPSLLGQLMKDMVVPVKQPKAEDGGTSKDDPGDSDGPATAKGATEERPTESLLARTESTFPKSQAYSRDKSLFGFVHGFLDQVLTVAFYLGGAYPWMWDKAGDMVVIAGYTRQHEILRSCAFMMVFYVATTIVVSLPFSLYRTFVLEEKHGFNKSTVGTFFGDMAKKMALSALLGLPIVALLVWIVRSTGRFFWVYCWACVFVLVLFFMTVYPNWIAPLFNKFTALEEGPLRSRIEALAAKHKFPLTKLFVVDGSRRSAHSNAYMYGWGKNKRIVLFDTLLEQAEPDEIEAILGHELGHWKMGHTLRMMIITQVIMFVQFALFGLWRGETGLLASFGFNTTEPATLINLLLFFEVAFSPLSPLMSFGMNAMSRSFEFAADNFAVTNGYAAPLSTGLVKLHIENMGALSVDWLYSSYHYSHPPLVERLGAIHTCAQGKKVA